MSEEDYFIDIMVAKSTFAILKYMTSTWDPKYTMDLERKYSPQELKEITANSVYLDSFIDAQCAKSGQNKEILRKEMLGYLDEMGFDKKIYLYRWMGVLYFHIANMMKIKILVSNPVVLDLKCNIGSNPVLFLPTHRSYADFLILCQLCYFYQIDFPAIAAGMDFQSMAVIGKVIRETGSFYLRRTILENPLYAATLSQYVKMVVSHYSGPVKFFIEGTRSRSNKALQPKYGMLSMSLIPLFARQVSDITVVPISISYERLMEQRLYAYEHLGVPKPKESTHGMIKSLRSLNDNYGNMYINFAPSISARNLFDDNLLSDENLQPQDMQQLTPDQFRKVQELGDIVVSLQQAKTVVTMTNLLATVLMDALIKNKQLHFDEALKEIGFLKQMLKDLGVKNYIVDDSVDLDRILLVQSSMVKLDRERRLRLISNEVIKLTDEIKKQMKGHILHERTMSDAVPVIQLQLYVNPLLQYLVPSAVVYLLVRKGTTTERELETSYRLIRKLLKYEFFHIEETETNTFRRALEHCIDYKVICSTAGSLAIGDNIKLQHLLEWTVWPTLDTMLKCAETMGKIERSEHKQALKHIQEYVERCGCHPYCLSLEAMANCLQGLVTRGALVRHRKEGHIFYNVVPSIMDETKTLLRSILPQLVVDFSRRNCIITDIGAVTSRL